MRPISNTMRRQLGAFDSSAEIASGRRCRLALANYHAFAIENANMRLVHRNIEASKIVHRSVSSSTSWPIVSAFAEELPTITRC